MNTEKLYEMWSPGLYVSKKDEILISESFQLNPDYAYIKISDDNDYMIGRYLSNNTKVIVELKSIIEFGSFLNYCKKSLRRNPYGILVSPEYLYQGEMIPYFNSLLSSPFSENFGLINPNIGDIEKWRQVTGQYPSLVSLKICPPISFPKDTIDFCQSHGILMVSTNISEGSSIFPLYYLYRLAAKYTNIVIIDSQHVEETIMLYNMLNDLHGKEIDQDTDSLLTFNKNIDNPGRFNLNGISKINTFINIAGDTWKLDNMIYPLSNIILSADNLESINTSKVLSQDEDYVLSNTSEELPGDVKDLGEQRYIIRNTVEALLYLRYKDKLKFLEIESNPVSDNLTIITLSSKFFKLINISRSFILYINEGPNMIFKEIPQKEVEKV